VFLSHDPKRCLIFLHAYFNIENFASSILTLNIYPFHYHQQNFTYGPVIFREEPTEPYTYLQLDPPRRVEVNLEQTASES
jgi:hypothetical protein